MTRGGWGDGTLDEVQPGKWRFRLPPYLGRSQVTFPARNKTEAKKQAAAEMERAYQRRFHPEKRQAPTFDEMAELVLQRHHGDRDTVDKLGKWLARPRAAFGDVRLDDPSFAGKVREWRKALVGEVRPVTAHTYMRAVKQVCNAAVKDPAIPVTESPVRFVENPEPKAAPVNPFETVAEVEAVVAELAPEWRLVPYIGVGCGLRVEEWAALERADLHDDCIVVSKRWTGGRLKPGTKNGEAERQVPLHPWVQQAVSLHPHRIDTRLLFPGVDGEHLKMDWFRREVWQPALDAAGVTYRAMKDMRHTYASWQLAGNANVWTLAKVMGTSVTQIERTYGRFIPGSERVVLAAMDAFLASRKAIAK